MTFFSFFSNFTLMLFGGNKWGITKPGLLVSFNLNGKAKVCQLHSCAFRFGSQKQVLWLETNGTKKKSIKLNEFSNQ